MAYNIVKYTYFQSFEFNNLGHVHIFFVIYIVKQFLLSRLLRYPQFIMRSLVVNSVYRYSTILFFLISAWRFKNQLVICYTIPVRIYLLRITSTGCSFEILNRLFNIDRMQINTENNKTKRI